jgi:hypothetical protein
MYSQYPEDGVITNPRQGLSIYSSVYMNIDKSDKVGSAETSTSLYRNKLLHAPQVSLSQPPPTESRTSQTWIQIAWSQSFHQFTVIPHVHLNSFIIALQAGPHSNLYAVPSSPLSPRPSWTKIPSSASYCQTPSTGKIIVETLVFLGCYTA